MHLPLPPCASTLPFCECPSYYVHIRPFTYPLIYWISLGLTYLISLLEFPWYSRFSFVWMFHFPDFGCFPLSSRVGLLSCSAFPLYALPAPLRLRLFCCLSRPLYLTSLRALSLLFFVSSAVGPALPSLFIMLPQGCFS